MRQIEINIQKDALKTAQIELERSKKGYFELYESAPVMYFILNADLIIIDVSRAGAALFNTEINEIIDRSFIQYAAPASYETIYSNIQLSETSNQIHKCEIELLNHKHVHLDIKAIFNSDNVLKNYIIILSDLIKTKRTGIKLFEGEGVVDGFVQHNTGALVCDADKVRDKLNNSLKNLPGYQADNPAVNNDNFIEDNDLASANQLTGDNVYPKLPVDISRDIKRIASDVSDPKNMESDSSLFNNMLNGLAYCKMIFEDGLPKDFKYIYVNYAFESLTGLNDVVGKNVSELIPNLYETDLELFEIYGRVALTGTPEIFDMYIEPLKMWFSVSAYSPYKNYFVAIFDVINERKKAEKQLSENEEKYHKLFEYANDMITLNYLSDDGSPINFTEVNRVGIDRLGYSRQEFLNMSPVDIVAPECRYKMKEIAKKLKNNTNARYRIVHMTKDGTRIPVEINNHLFELDGKTAALAISRDISASQMAEIALKESEKKYRDLAELVPQIVYETDKEIKITFVSRIAYKIMGYTPEELDKGLTLLDFVVPEDLRRASDNIHRIFNGEKLGGVEYTIIRKDGKKIPVIVYTDTIISNNKITGLRGIITDISNIKDAKDKIKASLKEKELLLKEIHHRVKNNMQIISSLLSLQKHYTDDEEAIEVLIESQNRVKTMAMIHEKLYQSENFTHIHFDDYIERLVKDMFYSYDIKPERIKLSLDIEEVKLNIETAIPCGLIISELVSNSLKYAFPTRKKGEIHISLKQIGDKYELVIGEDGIGFPKNIDFKKTDSLGLQLVNSLVSQLDGSIKLDTSCGTEFTIIFGELIYKKRI